MKRRLIYVVFICSAGLFNCAAIAASSEQADERAAEHEIRFDEIEADKEMGGHIDGKVVGINNSTKKIIIDEEDTFGKDDFNQTEEEENADTDAIFVYTIKPDTTFINARSIEDINTGDILSVDYYNFSYNRIATTIILEKKANKKELSSQNSGILKSK